MNTNNDLFPFPGQNDNDDAEVVVKPDLPVFPPDADTANRLTPHEISQVRKIIEVFAKIDPEKLLEKEQNQASVIEPELPAFPLPRPEAAPAPATEPLAKSETEIATTASSELRQSMLKFLDAVSLSEIWEIQTRTDLKVILDEIENNNCFATVFAAITGVFPARKCLRHGTPDQKLFALIAISDRFLTTISGQIFPGRKKLLKSIGAYLSAISEHYSFIQMENETFSPQYHERIQGSSSTGRTIREMHGYLVVGKDNKQVVRTGLVLT